MKAKIITLAIVLGTMLALNACSDEIIMPTDGATVTQNGPDD